MVAVDSAAAVLVVVRELVEVPVKAALEEEEYLEHYGK